MSLTQHRRGSDATRGLGQLEPGKWLSDEIIGQFAKLFNDKADIKCLGAGATEAILIGDVEQKKERMKLKLQQCQTCAHSNEHGCTLW